MIVEKTENGVRTEKTIFAKDLIIYLREGWKPAKAKKAEKKVEKKKEFNDDLGFESFGKKKK